MKHTRIYVDLDSLLDTRSATLYSIVEDKDSLVEYLSSDEYNYRHMDSFTQLVSDEYYKDAYSNRDKSILPYSVVSYILTLIKGKVDGLEKLNVYKGESTKAEVLINTYPYRLTDEEENTLRDMFFIKLASPCLVSIIHHAPFEITPSYIHTSNIASAFIYDFSNWITHHAQAIDKTDLKDFSLYTPSIGKSEVDISEIKKLGFNDIFTFTEFYLCKAFNLSFLPSLFYSALPIAILHLDKLEGEIPKEEEEYPIKEEDLPASVIDSINTLMESEHVNIK